MKKGWEVKTLEECIDSVPSTNKILKKNFKIEGEYPVISQEAEIISGYWDKTDDVFTVDSPVVVYGDHTRVVKYIDFDFVRGADGVKILKPKPFLNSRYLYYFLNFCEVKHLGYARHYRLLKGLEVVYPALSEQKRIVKILDEKFAEIEKLKKVTEEQLASAKELFENRLNEVFVSDTKRKQILLSDILKLEYGKPLDRSDRSDRSAEGAYPVYGANGIKAYSEKYFCDQEGIVVGRKGSAGEVTLTQTKFWPLDVTYFVTFDRNQNNLAYIFYLLKSLKLQQYATGVKPGLNRNDAYAIRINYESLGEQLKVVKELDKLSKQTKDLEAIFMKKVTELEELKKSYLHEAFSGNL